MCVSACVCVRCSLQPTGEGRVCVSLVRAHICTFVSTQPSTNHYSLPPWSSIASHSCLSFSAALFSLFFFAPSLSPFYSSPLSRILSFLTSSISLHFPTLFSPSHLHSRLFCQRYSWLVLGFPSFHIAAPPLLSSFLMSGLCPL